MTLSADIKRMLDKAKVPYGQVEEESHELFPLLQQLLPSRCITFDAECIDSPGEYALLLEDLVALTDGDIQPTAIDIRGAMDGTVEVSMRLDRTRETFGFPQGTSDYVASEFFDRLNELLARKRRQGRFLTLPTTDQSIACAYLPKALVDLLRKKRLDVQQAATADAIVTYLIEGGDPYSMDWDDTPFDALNGFTRDGETVVTAIMKARLPDENTIYTSGSSSTYGILESLRETSPIYIAAQNRCGETPLALYHQQGRNDHGLLGVIEERSETVRFDELCSLYQFASMVRRQAALRSVVEAAEAALRHMYFNRNLYHALQFAHRPDFVVGEDSASLAFDGECYELHIQRPGLQGARVLRQYRQDQAVEVAEIIRRYCGGELW